jgi:hypothetical protein
LAFHVHDRNDPDTVRFVDEDDGVRKIVAEMSPGRRVKFSKAFGIRNRFIKQAFDLSIETHAESGRNFRIVRDGPANSSSASG